MSNKIYTDRPFTLPTKNIEHLNNTRLTKLKRNLFTKTVPNLVENIENTEALAPLVINESGDVSTNMPVLFLSWNDIDYEVLAKAANLDYSTPEGLAYVESCYFKLQINGPDQVAEEFETMKVYDNASNPPVPRDKDYGVDGGFNDVFFGAAFNIPVIPGEKYIFRISIVSPTISKESDYTEYTYTALAYIRPENVGFEDYGFKALVWTNSSHIYNPVNISDPTIAGWDILVDGQLYPDRFPPANVTLQDVDDIAGDTELTIRPFFVDRFENKYTYQESFSITNVGEPPLECGFSEDWQEETEGEFPTGWSYVGEDISNWTINNGYLERSSDGEIIESDYVLRDGPNCRNSDITVTVDVPAVDVSTSSIVSIVARYKVVNGDQRGIQARWVHGTGVEGEEPGSTAELALYQFNTEDQDLNRIGLEFPYQVSAGQYNIRLRVEEETVQAKIWETVTSEPIDWQVGGIIEQGVNTTPADQGQIGFSSIKGSRTGSLRETYVSIINSSIENYSLSFRGDNSVNINMSDTEDGEFTLMCWVNPESWSAGNYNNIIGGDGDGNPGTGNIASITLRNDSGQINANMRVDGEGFINIREDIANVPNGVWTHLAVTFNGFTMKLFADFVQIGSATTSSATDIEALFINSLGYRQFDRFNVEVNDRYYDGLLDEVALFNNALSQSLIERYGKHGIPQYSYPPNLIRYWKMKELMGNLIVDEIIEEEGDLIGNINDGMWSTNNHFES